MVAQAAKAFCKGLHNALNSDCFVQETLFLNEGDLAAIDTHLSGDGPLALPEFRRRTAGMLAHRPAYGFAFQRPVMPSLAA